MWFHFYLSSKLELVELSLNFGDIQKDPSKYRASIKKFKNCCYACHVTLGSYLFISDFNADRFQGFNLLAGPLGMRSILIILGRKSSKRALVQCMCISRY